MDCGLRDEVGEEDREDMEEGARIGLKSGDMKRGAVDRLGKRLEWRIACEENGDCEGSCFCRPPFTWSSGEAAA